MALRFRSDESGRRAGFTLIELLVVVGIIVLLVAILLPTMKYTRDAARRAATQNTLAMIDTGLQGYFNDFNSYPPSVPSNFNAGTLNRGSVMLAQGLTGYLDSSSDGAGPSNAGDPAYGFRVVTGGNGRIYGPYANPSTGKAWRANSTTDQVLIDGYGNEILYYRSTLAVPPAQWPTTPPTQVFGASNCLFITADNSAATNNNGTNSNGGAVADPAASTASKFWSQIGTTGNSLSTGVVQGRNTYLLVSAGPDGIYFSNDDVLSGR